MMMVISLLLQGQFFIMTCAPIYSGIEIGLERTVYTASEGDTVEVCARVVEGELERVVEVALSTVEGSATG